MEEIVQQLRELFININYKQLKAGEILNRVYEAIEENPELVEAYGTFPMLLAEMGRSFKQVKPFMTAMQWAESVGLKFDDVKDIPLTKLNLMYKNEVPLTDELIYELKELSYTDLNIKYGDKAEYEYDKN